jgi:hypothetical protein
MRMKLYVLILAALAFMAVTAFDVLPGTGVPEVVVYILTAFLIPGLVAVAKTAADKWPAQLGWLNGKFWLSILTYILASIVVAAFIQWKAIPALPEDPGLAVTLVLGYVNAFFGAATGLYNMIIGPIHNRVG